VSMIHRAWLYVHGKREAGSQTDGQTDRDQTRIAISGRQSFDPKSEIDSGNTARGASRIHCVAARMIVCGRDRDKARDGKRAVSSGSDNAGGDASCEGFSR
jgi:hypothetical protein